MKTDINTILDTHFNGRPSEMHYGCQKQTIRADRLDPPDELDFGLAPRRPSLTAPKGTLSV